MKKRFTVMLDEKIIRRIKNINTTPSYKRELIEKALNQMCEYEENNCSFEVYFK